VIREEVDVAALPVAVLKVGLMFHGAGDEAEVLVGSIEDEGGLNVVSPFELDNIGFLMDENIVVRPLWSSSVAFVTTMC
jgi:hypothetical protein